MARDTYLETAVVAVETIALPVVASMWLRPSSLPGWQVATLCGHLGAGTTATVLHYIDSEPPPEGAAVVDAVGYYTAALAMVDSDPTLAAGVTERAEAAARGGQAGVVDAAERALDLLRERLSAEPPERTVAVFGGIAMTLDEYLVTRIVELCVHIDDLAVAVGIDTPEIPAEATTTALRALVELSARRRGALGVLRALTRTERPSGPIGAF